MNEIQALTKEVREIKSMIRQQAKVNPWVNGQILTGLTVWSDSNKLRRARENKLVVYKVVDGSMLYNLDSIHSLFIKK